MPIDPHSPPVAIAAPLPHASPAMRALFWFCGTLALLLAVAGAVLPVMPTTPFVLLAASCYAKASPRFHAWLLANRWCGPLIADWERHRSIPRQIKWVAFGSMAFSGSISFYLLAGRPWLQLALVMVILGAVWWLGRIPTRRP